jgi:ABC-type transporter Mla maintaining outer membrane lipid asymmetry ATPase subunit MlaF
MDYEEEFKKLQEMELEWQGKIDQLRKKRDAIVSNYIASLRADLIKKKKENLK